MLDDKQLKRYKSIWTKIAKAQKKSGYTESFDDERVEITEYQYEAQSVLTCCQAAKDINAVTWNGSRWVLNVSSEAISRFSATSLQKIQTKDGTKYTWKEDPQPTACPYCGTGLPKMRKFKIGVPVFNTDDEDECSSCYARMDCICLAPGATYRPVKKKA